MWEQILEIIGKILGPNRPADGNGGEIMLAVSGVAIRVQIPTWLAGCYAEFTAIDANVEVLEGGSAVAAVYGQVSSVGSEVITTNAATGRRLVQGTTRAWVVSRAANATHLSIIASGAGFIQISKTSQRVLRGS